MKRSIVVIGLLFLSFFVLAFAPSAHADELATLDVCSNIEGVQAEVPEGMEQQYQGGGEGTPAIVVCVPADEPCPGVDVCPSIAPSPVVVSPDIQLPTVPNDKELAHTGTESTDTGALGASIIFLGVALILLAGRGRR